MRSFFVVLFIVNITSVLFGQSILREGEFCLDKVRYYNTIKSLEPVFQRSPSREMALELAEAFCKIRKYEKALVYYETALLDAPLNEPQTFNYFESLYNNGDLELARKVANECVSRFRKNQLLAKMDTAESMKLFDQVYFEKSVRYNNTDNEFGFISFFDNYKFVNSDILFNKLLTTKTFNPYIINTADTLNGKPKYMPLLPQIPNEHNIISHYDAIEDKVYITRTTLKPDNFYHSKILIGTVDDNFNLVNLVEFPYNSLDYSVGHASVSQDGEILYFVSDKSGGFGGADIYRCMKLEDGTWGFPINIGNMVNSQGDEIFPYIAPNGTTLYFASSYHSILGGFDLNKSEKTRSHSFRKPENLGVPFNSEKDDYAVTFSDDYGTEGFYSTNRFEGTKGGSDAYSFSYENNKVCKDPVKNFKMIAVDKKTRARIPNVRLKMTVKLDGRVYEDISDNNGEVHLLVEGCNDFDVEATHDIYLNNLFYYDGFKKTVVIELIKKELNNIIGLEKIFYEYGKHDIPSASIPQLNKLAVLLKKNTDIKIELSSHTDSRGDDAFNQKLSQKRAESIVNFLVQAGVSAKQLVAQGYGETKLVNECGNEAPCTEEQHEKNRRTEFKILEINTQSP